MQRSYALRKGRYVQLIQNDVVFIGKIIDSTIVLKEPIYFNIFNFPVECIELDKSKLLVSEPKVGISVMSIIDIKKNYSNTFSRNLLIKDNKLYVPLSEIEFASKYHVDLFRELRGQ